MSNLTTNTSYPTNDTSSSPNDKFLFSGTSDAWAQVIANVGTLLVLVGEKNVKAYFKTMHNPSYYSLFASSPIGLVTAITTLIRLSNARLNKRLIGRQFEPWAQVLLDVTSVSAGPVGLELLNGRLEPSITPDPEKVASFWIRGEKNGSADELITWTRGTAEFLYERATRQELGRARCDSCYDRRAGLSTANAFRATGPCAVWIAREKALDSWEAMWPVLAPHDGYIRGGTGESKARCSELKGLCRDKSNNIDPGLQNTSCKGVGLAIAHWTDVSLALTAGGGYKSSVLNSNKFRYLFSGLFALANTVILVTMDQAGHKSAGSVGIALLIISASSWWTAWGVDKASAEESVDLSCFGAAEAGFVSRQNSRGVQLNRCPERVVISENARGSDGFQKWGGDWFQKFGGDNSRRITEAFLVSMVIGLMAGGLCYLYLSLRAAPVWAPISVILVAATSSCVRSMCETEAPLEKNGIPAIPYFQADPMGTAVPCALSFQDELNRMGWARGATASEIYRAAATATVTATATGAAATAAAAACVFPRRPVDPLVLSYSYVVLVPDVRVLGGSQQQSLWNIDDGLMKGFFFRALQLAHSMRVQSVAPVEVGRFGRGDGPLSRTELVFLYCDVLVPEHVLRQSMEVLVSPAVDIRTPSLMLEQICIAVFAIANRAFRVLGYEVGGATLDLGMDDAQNYQVVEGVTLQTIPWEKDMSWKAYTPLTWVAAKIIYVTMLKASEDVMMQLGMQWFGGFEELSNNDITGFLRSLQHLGLVVGRNDS